MNDPDRKTAANFADHKAGETKEIIEKRYAATGDFYCGKEFYGQGQLTIKDDIITTSAHILTKSVKTCPVTLAPLSKCKFTLRHEGKLHDFDIDRIVDTGFKCTSNGQKLKGSQDWIVLKLKKHVDPKIRPYPIAQSSSFVAENPDVVMVAKSHDFNPTNKSDIRLAERHYGRCHLRSVYGERTSPLAVESDCDASPNSSGGSVLVPGDQPELLAIVSGGLEDCGSSDKTGPYQKGCWATVMTPIAGDFRRTLEDIKSNDFPGYESAQPDKRF